MKRVWTLDGLRGLAAISVVIYHGLYWHGDLLYSSAGRFAVYLFFILSAMTMMKVYAGRFSAGLDVRSLNSFYRNRVARILPLLALVAALNFVFELLRGGNLVVEGPKAILTATGAFGFGAAGILSNSAGAWSIGIEIVFYAVFPLVALLAHNAQLRTLILGAVALTVLQFAHNLFVFSTYGADTYWPIYIMPISFAAYFAWGLVLGRLSPKPISFGWIGVPAILVLIWISLVGWQSISSLLAWPGALIVPLFLSGGTYLIYCWTHPSWFIPSFRFLGEVSYSLYLLHPLVYFGLTRTFWPANTGNVLQFVVLFVMTSLITAWLAHHLFEKPMRRWIRSAGRSATLDKSEY
ncbi:acyltransferase [Parasphingorhabdus sp.]|uniref:acyltransferase family protein n=1 Tax=Parasphingorhabdus sp. TaxID=2709688 RepID=UPI003264DD04